MSLTFCLEASSCHSGLTAPLEWRPWLCCQHPWTIAISMQGKRKGSGNGLSLLPLRIMILLTCSLRRSPYIQKRIILSLYIRDPSIRHSTHKRKRIKKKKRKHQLTWKISFLIQQGEQWIYPSSFFTWMHTHVSLSCIVLRKLPPRGASDRGDCISTTSFVTRLIEGTTESWIESDRWPVHVMESAGV